MLQQAVAISVVHAEGGDGFVEALAMFFEGGFDGRAQAGVGDAADDAEEVGLHLDGVVLRDRRETAHDGGVGTLGVGDRGEGIDLEVGAAVEITDDSAHADDRAGLEGDEHGLDRRIAEDADLDVIRGVRDDGLVIGRTGLGGLGGDVTQGADGLEARADRGGLAFAEGQEDFGHGARVAGASAGERKLVRED